MTRHKIRVGLYTLTEDEFKSLKEDGFKEVRAYKEFIYTDEPSYYVLQELGNIFIVYINTNPLIFKHRKQREDEIYFIGIHHIYKTKQYGIREVKE